MGDGRRRDRVAVAACHLADDQGGRPLLTAVDTATFLRGTGHSIAAAGASAVLVMGFPVLLKATSGDLGATGGVVILAVTLTRARCWCR
ncbi:hypothetical protein MHIP_59760 [Mycolicibacterium hippocampi]|uniref:Uncharacterized protein n=1 Tax=Mycolicibacterium hippocampi TaxID=659824 RepID=A0A7I9ZXI5_9MYCO|nr:hypothetical protein MHIP_59760 [Mycolicibacterium hippocampi]